MVYQQSPISTTAGFHLLSTTLILVFIIISCSLAFAHIQVQRIQRNDLNLNYLQARILAESELDQFYITLYTSPALLDFAPACSNSTLAPEQLVVVNNEPHQYEYIGSFYLCKEEIGYFNVSIIHHFNGSEQLILERRLLTLSEPWGWHPVSLIGF